MEPCDDSGECDASDVLNNSKDFITDSDMPAVQQVNSFISNIICDSFVTLVTFR